MNHYPHLNDIFITERLKRRLGEINISPIISVIAPMGFGKTTAINVFIKRLKKSHTKTVILRQIIVTNSITDFWCGFCHAFKKFPELYERFTQKTPLPTTAKSAHGQRTL